MRSISYETAQLCAEIGYKGPHTQSEVQEWLRKKHDCFVVVTPEAYDDGVNWNVQVLFYDATEDGCWARNSTGMFGDNGEFPTYEDALEFGLKIALGRL